METSMRFDSESRKLFLRAKEDFVGEGNVVLQVQGALCTDTGNCLGALQIRKKFFPQLLSTVDVGTRIDLASREVTYSAKGKKAFELTDNGSRTLDIKGGVYFHANSQKWKTRASVELCQKVFNFTMEQDLKLKLGCNLVTQRPYIQLRENNWTLNTDFRNGFKDFAWSVSYDL